MDARYEEKYHTLEEQHWWFRARRHMVYTLVQELNLPPDAAILEVGCSAGPLLLQLQQAGYTNLTGIDVSKKAIALGQQRGLKGISVMDGAKITFPDAAFDLVITSDVLEHIADDAKAIQEWARVLKSGGKMIVFVPAFQHLWSGHDVVNHHFRRYTKTQLKAIVAQAGLQVNRASYWNFSLYFPTWVVRRLQNSIASENSPHEDNLQQVPGIVNGVLTTLVKLENKVLKKMDLPIGVSTFVLAEKV
ncbi:class I SAM-dependent methyltransferase [Pontibacter sp. KCTC 32443]|uniref:class I SAM-dependent methyltransferase n=1 Tax=Pontibacter TaxID=323449 RepID=UPI00164D9AC0|nr:MULTISPECIES: class I SAM-dependent methyltransferase [Pontibacter]MBC5774449.1 class I SAM-dependent methyltransferase [Pontibacter sp. KCTC 32443]